MAKLKLAILALSHMSSLGCEACKLGKHHRSYFLRSSHDRQTESFDVVQTDIWVLLELQILMGNNYLLYLLMIILA